MLKITKRAHKPGNIKMKARVPHSRFQSNLSLCHAAVLSVDTVSHKSESLLHLLLGGPLLSYL